MTIAEERSRSTICAATLRGCGLTLIHLRPLAGHDASCLLQLDRANQTYTRSLTGPELAALARLNPEDGAAGSPELASILANLALAFEMLRPDGWEGMRVFSAATGKMIPNALLTPFSGDEVIALGRLAGELLAACGVS